MTALALRRTDSPYVREEERDAFWTVLCEGVAVGSIVSHRGRSDATPAWHWTIHLHAGHRQTGLMPIGGTAETREAAMLAFRAAWDRVRPAIGEEGWACHARHMAHIRARAAKGTAPRDPG